MKTIIKYQLPNGKIPFDEWFVKLDKAKKARVLIRLERVKNGLFGQYRKLSGGISELKFTTGERIYISEIDDIIIILLTAGGKKRQNNDIECAFNYLKDYYERIEND